MSTIKEAESEENNLFRVLNAILNVTSIVRVLHYFNYFIYFCHLHGIAC